MARRAGGSWAISPGHKDPEAPISGIPFMVDEDGKQEVKQEVKQEGGKN